MEIRKLMEECARVSVEHGFGETNRDISTSLMLMVTELSEAYEAWRDGGDIREITHIEKADGSGAVSHKPDGFPVELADVLIRLLAFCEINGVPLERATRLKMAYNEGRPFKHGGKRV